MANSINSFFKPREKLDLQLSDVRFFVHQSTHIYHKYRQHLPVDDLCTAERRDLAFLPMQL
ncbi:hypothetical protein, partial [Vibrio anguillarum]|uniref:hypothetical protein n=1 Tax=Vibrio anguillarum TaxID=55601 RepID=UPI001BE41DB3